MAEKKGELANFQARKRKLHVWKVAVLVVLVLVIIYFVMSAVKIINLNREKLILKRKTVSLKRQWKI